MIERELRPMQAVPDVASAVDRLISLYDGATAYLRRDRILDETPAAGRADPGLGRGPGGAPDRRRAGHGRARRRPEAAPAHRHRLDLRRLQLKVVFYPGMVADQLVAGRRHRHGERDDRRAGLSLARAVRTRRFASPTSRCTTRPSCPARADAFYDHAVSEHLRVGLTALDVLRADRQGLHARKLRSFDEPPFR